MVYGVIYKITNTKNGMIYIGQTTRSVKERFSEHMKSDYFIGRAIRHDGVENFTVEVIEECETLKQLNEREKFWIAFFNCMAPNGYNLTDGGQQGASPSAESRQKMSDAHTGVKRSPETVARMSESQKGKVLSPEHRAKLSEANRGHEVSPETRRKISEAQKGKKLSPETRAKLKGRKRSSEFCERMSKALKGRKLSPEHRRRISEAQKGKTLSPEHRAKLKGCKRSPETCARISEVQKGKQIPADQRAKMSEAKKGKPFSDEHRKNLSAALKNRPRRRPTAYPTLSAELIRQKFSYAKIGELLGYSQATISKRMQGSPEFTPEQQAAIKKFLGVDMSVEELFRRQ